MTGTIRLVSGSASKYFTEKILKFLQGESVKTRIIRTEIGKFPDGETKVRIEETVRGYHIYVVQSTCPPVNDNLVELCLIIDALKRASAQMITAVIPYFGYSRQEKRGIYRTPISARVAAKFIEGSGADRVLTMDFHSSATSGFFDIPTDDLSALPIFNKYFRQILPDSNNLVIVSPDAGGTARARMLAEALCASLAIIEKRRNEVSGEINAINLVGEVDGKIAIIIDDIISSGKTLTKAAELLKEHGAQKIWSGATHGIFSGKAIEIIESSLLEGVVVSDTISMERQSAKIQQISATEIFADTIRRIQENRSVSALFHI